MSSPQPGEGLATSPFAAELQAQTIRPLRPLRVAQVTSLFPPAGGGAGPVCAATSLELARLGHEVHVFTTAQPGAPGLEERQGVQVHRLRAVAQSGGAAVVPGLLWALRDFDLIHLYYPFFGGALLPHIAQRRRPPLVVTYHQDGEPPGLRGVIKRLLRQTAGRSILRAAERLLFTSAEYAQAAPVWSLLRGREHTVGELPPGVDLLAFAPGAASADLRARYGLLHTDQVVLLVAHLDKAHTFQGVNVFLSALARLPPHVKGLIIGDGDQRVEYQVAARVLGVDSRLIFAGRVAPEDLPAHYRLAAVTVLPAVIPGDSFGATAVQSLASGVPVVASDLPGVRAAVTQGSDGVLIAPGNPAALAGALGWVLRYEANRHLLGMRGRAKAEETYGWRQIARRLETIYCQVLAEGQGVPVWHLRSGAPGLPYAMPERERP